MFRQLTIDLVNSRVALLHVFQLPLEDGSLPGQMVRNRLNSTLPSVLQARSNELMDRPSAKAQAFPFEGLRDLDVGPSLQTSEIDGGPESDDPSSQFTVVGHAGSANAFLLIIERAVRSEH